MIIVTEYMVLDIVELYVIINLLESYTTISPTLLVSLVNAISIYFIVLHRFLYTNIN